MTDMRELQRIASQFRINGIPAGIKETGNGHINDTFIVESAGRRGQDHGRPERGSDVKRYILQRVNDHVFRDPYRVMDNIITVTDKLRSSCASRGGSEYPLRFIPAADGSYLVRTGSGYWRMMTYIENSYACEEVRDAEQFRVIGRAYGSFIGRLSDLPAGELHETIEHFHDTGWRFGELLKACSSDPVCRRSSAAEEISFALAREKDADILTEAARRGELPLRVTHNDTKINNVLLDRDTDAAVCVIDLDTVMPGLAVTDFGDAVRSGASTGKEDASDADDVRLDPGLYKAFRSGFIEGFPGLTDREIALLPEGARIMALECGIRFLTDYLDGDRYFKTDHDDHNLIRCRTQFRLVRDIEEKWDELQSL